MDLASKSVAVGQEIESGRIETRNSTFFRKSASAVRTAGLNRSLMSYGSQKTFADPRLIRKWKEHRYELAAERTSATSNTRTDSFMRPKSANMRSSL